LKRIFILEILLMISKKVIKTDGKVKSSPPQADRWIFSKPIPFDF